MSRDKPEDIEQVRREEEGRSKRTPVDPDKLRAQREREREWRATLRGMKFSEAIHALGLQPGTSEYEQFALIWRQYQRDRGEAERRPRPRQPGKP